MSTVSIWQWQVEDMHVSTLKEEKATFLDQYIGREITLVATKR